jgi:hypothetical protein
METSTLHCLLDRSLDLPLEYGSGLSSHLPMALHALGALGAGEARMASYFDGYAVRFAGRSGRAEPLADWNTALGRFEAVEALRASFERQLARAGTEATLRAALPRLWPGVVGAAFHGLIRTAHAVQSGHPGEQAAALAYWAARWQPLHAPRAPPMAWADWRAALEAAALAKRTPGGSISARVAVAAQGAAFRELAGALPAGAARLQDLADWAAVLYARSGNFTVLHMVTGLRAARVLLGHTDDPAAAWPHLVPAVVAAALASNLALEPAPPLAITWAEARERAIASDDDHVIKLVHACVEESEHYGAGARLAAVARALG